jgi:hypothetical protein
MLLAEESLTHLVSVASGARADATVGTGVR